MVQSMRSLTPGTMTAPRSIVLNMASPPSGELQSTSKPWYSAILVRPPALVWPSPAIPRPAKTSSMVNTSLMLRARMLSPEYVPRNLLLRWSRTCQNRTGNCSRSARSSRNTSETCRTSNSLSRKASCGCYKRATANVPALPQSISLSTWSRNDLSLGMKPSCASPLRI